MKKPSRIRCSVVVLGLFLLAIAHAHNQDNSQTPPVVLDQVLDDTEPIHDVTTEEAVVLLLARARIPGGVIEVESCVPTTGDSRPKHSYVLSGLTPRQALDIIVSENTRYKWEAKNNIVNLIPVNGIPGILQTKVPHFKVSHDDSIEGRAARLFGTAEIQRAFTDNGMVREDRTQYIFGGAPLKMNRDSVFDNKTVMEILNTLLSSYKTAAVWHYTERVGKCKQSYYLEWPVR